jgi:hypothetical protein
MFWLLFYVICDIYIDMEFFDKDSMYHHCNAYNNNDKCTNSSPNENGFCDEHQHYDDIGHFDEKDKLICCAYIKCLLDECSVAKGKENKKHIAIAIFDFLLHCHRFIYLNKTFGKTMFDKMIDLQKDGFNSTIYLESLFPYYENKNENNLELKKTITDNFPMSWSDF